MYTSVRHFIWKIISIVDYYLEDTYTEKLLSTFWDIFSDLWYFLILGAFVSVLVSRLLPRGKISESLKRRGNLSVLLCTLLGLVSPMPTLAAIPIVGALLSLGVPAPPLMAFLVASPLMNPLLFIYTVGVMGIEMALARAIGAFFLSLSAGTLTHLLTVRRFVDFSEPVRQEIPASGQQRGHLVVAGGASLSLWGEMKALWGELRRMIVFIGKYFLLGATVASLVRVFVPPDRIAFLVGPQNSWSVLLAVAMGVPLYTCGGGTIPVIDVLTKMGMNQGAALAFFISGPATKVSTVLTLNAVAKKKVLILYLIVTLVGAAVLGYVYSVVGPDIRSTPMLYV